MIGSETKLVVGKDIVVGEEGSESVVDDFL